MDIFWGILLTIKKVDGKKTKDGYFRIASKNDGFFNITASQFTKLTYYGIEILKTCQIYNFVSPRYNVHQL